jgi:hypothetical protein
MSVKCGADASAIAPVRGVCDSPRIFKRLRTAVCAGLSQFGHIAGAAVAGTKDLPD